MAPSREPYRANRCAGDPDSDGWGPENKACRVVKGDHADPGAAMTTTRVARATDNESCRAATDSHAGGTVRISRDLPATRTSSATSSAGWAYKRLGSAAAHTNTLDVAAVAPGTDILPAKRADGDNVSVAATDVRIFRQRAFLRSALCLLNDRARPPDG